MVCPVCSCQLSLAQVRSIPYNKKTAPGCPFEKICFCPSCAVGIACPPLTDEAIGRIYTDGDYWRKYKVDHLLPRKNPGHYAMAQARWQFVEDHIISSGRKPEVSILDVGAGYGFFGMAAAQSRKVRLTHIGMTEQDKFFRESLAKTWQKFFPQYAMKAWDSLKEAEGKYDVIVLSHILEHLNDPGAMLAEAISKLSDGGMVFVDVPHEDFLFKSDAFPHVLFYNASSVKELLSRSGLRLAAMDCYGRSRRDMAQGEGGAGKLLENIVFKARHVLPVAVSTAFFDRTLAPAKKNSDGVWLRALAALK